MDTVKKQWRIIAFGLACAASLGIGVWQVMASSEITERMGTIQQLTGSVRSLSGGAANKDTIEARRKELEAKKAQFDSIEAVALSVQKNNAFYEEVDEQGNVTPSPRQPIAPNVLPGGDAVSQGERFGFRSAYASGFDQLLRKIRAADQPSAEDIQEARRRIEAIVGGPSNLGTHSHWEEILAGPQVARKDDKKQRTKLEILRNYPHAMAAYERAQQIWMYVSPNAFGRHPVADSTSNPTDAQIWEAQMSLWIQQDIAAAFHRCNARRVAELKAAGRAGDAWVAHLPVKHLKVLVLSNRLGGGESGGSNIPQGGFPPQSPTKVVNNNEMFVVPIQMTIVLEEGALPQLLEQLAAVGFYTPINIVFRDMEPNPLQVGYLYGDSPVVEATIDLEGYYFRKVFDPWIPKALGPLLAKPAPVGPESMGGGAGGGLRGGGGMRTRG